MKFVGIAAALLILALLFHAAAMTYFRARTARILMDSAQGFQNLSGDYTKTMLVLGDSTGVGVGADNPSESVAAGVASYIGATHVENYAVPGAEVANLMEQLEQATLARYDLILIQIGGNDIMLFHDAKQTAAKLDLALQELPESDTTILMSAGNVGGATIFPLVIRPFHTMTTMAYHRWFEKIASLRGVTYVNLYEPPTTDPFILEPERYLSKDGLHPSGEGYGLWAERVYEAVGK